MNHVGRWSLLLLLVLLGSAQAVAAGHVLLDQRALLLDDSRLPREAVLDRLQQVRFAFREAAPDAEDWPIWLRTYAARGQWDGGLSRHGEGLLVGIDRPLAGQWVGGALASFSQARVSADADEASSDSLHVGLYAATRIYYQLGIKLGVLHGWHTLDSGSDHARAQSWQAFAESSFAIDSRSWTLEPFAGLAWIRLDSGALRAAGVRLDGGSVNGRYLTLGWRLAAPWYMQDDKWIGRASLALRQNLGRSHLDEQGLDQAGNQQLLQGRTFERTGLRLDLSVDRELSERLYLGLTYAGAYARDARDHALAMRMSMKF